MTDQWLRQASLIVADDAGNGLDISQLRLRFVVTRGDIRTPHNASIRVNNLSAQTAQRIRDEFTRVQLQAGYPGTMSTVFQGDIVQKRLGREDALNTYLDIAAVDGDKAYNFGVINTTLAAGWTFQDMYEAILKVLKPYGIVAGYAPPFPGIRNPRGKAMFGMVRDQLQLLAQALNSSWYVQDDKLNIVPLYGYIDGEAIVLTSKTGMVGMPQKNLNGGISVRCLLNPAIAPGRLVQLDNASIQDAVISVDYTAINFVPQTDADGFYRVLAVNHIGDTRGQEWYSEIVCLARDDPGPPNAALLGFVNG
ncbi:phage protein [Bordetella bronchialis]|uniref:phage protein n=1 Tax=Bordetella bronchialis TaxID=463025 RepID=UPI003D02F595